MSNKNPQEIKSIKNDHYFQRVFDVTCMIPAGRVTTYGAIADFLGLGSARMVGWALNHSHSNITFIPAHRVVNRKGELSGRTHFATPTLMAELLQAEGIKVENDKIIDFDRFFWLPREIEQI